jgi:cytochrome c oxidase subunit 3
MFAGLTSAYIVRKGAGEWVNYKLPDIFWISTLVIILSSISIQKSYYDYKKENYKSHRSMLLVSLVLGFVFIVLQYLGWSKLASFGIRLQSNPSGAFFYVISGLHALHVIGGIVILLIFWVRSLMRTEPVKILLEEVNPERMVGHKLLVTYWHFIGILWIYLFSFLMINSLF